MVVHIVLLTNYQILCLVSFQRNAYIIYCYELLYKSIQFEIYCYIIVQTTNELSKHRMILSRPQNELSKHRMILFRPQNELSKHHMISELVVAFYNICPNPYTNNIVQHINAL